MSTGIRISDKDALAGLDYVFALHNGSTGPLSSTALATALVASGAVADALALTASASDVSTLAGRVDDLETGKADTTVTDGLDTRVEALEASGVDGAAYTSGGPVACATTANISLSGEQTIDGVLTSTDRILVKDQADASENGIYVTAAGAWSRATDMDAAGEVQGTAVRVSGGMANGGRVYVTYTEVTTLDTDDIIFVDSGDFTGLQDQIDLKAPLASPALTGTPTAPTATTGTDTTQVATTEFVQQELDASGALEFSTFETLAEGGPYLVDESGNVIADLSEVGAGVADAATAQAEINAARGDAASLTERLDRGLTDYGDLLGPIWGEWKLRSARNKLRLLQQGYSTQLVLNFFGDSWIEGPFIMPYLAKALHDVYGIAGLGWVGFQHFSATASTAYTDGGTQPNTLQGNARDDLVTTPVIDGTWSNNNGGTGAVANPSIGGVTCTSGSGYVRFSWTGATHDAADLHYFGDGTGVIRHSWDGGATWEANTSLSTVGVSHVALSNVPATASGSLRIERVSGNVSLAGVDMKSSADGVRVNALGASGSNSNQWASVDVAEWAGRVAVLGADFTAGLHGTNDQSGSPTATPDESAVNVTTLMTALRDEAPTMDLLWISPFENIRSGGSVYPMTDYAAAHRTASVSGGWAYLDLQYAVGDSTDIYENTTNTPFLEPLSGGNAGHPSRPEGGMQVTDAILRMIAPAI